MCYGQTIFHKSRQIALENFAPLILGCYGIGVGRAIASIAQESNDNDGLILPVSVAPWQVHMCVLRQDDPVVAEKANELYEGLQSAGIDVLMDDRNCGAGIKFKDADLIGFPFRITAGKSLTEGNVEFVTRNTGEKIAITPEQACQKVIEAVKSIK